MDSPQKMDVIDWQDSPRLIAPKVKTECRILPPTLIGILGTLLLHVILIQSVSFASRGPNPRRPESKESITLLPRATGDANNLVLISLPTAANVGEAVNPISSLPDLSKMKIKSRISADPPAFLNLETLALSEDQSSNSSTGEADGAELARLFGIYAGQIQARIDRVWRRPRSPVNEDNVAQNAKDSGESFQCEAQIIQDQRGNVQEILLPRCNGSPAWQRSLVAAIQHASPLPAPPSDNVFSHSITVRFVGLSYLPGSSDDDYELEARKLPRE